jgi:hypothetical protein
MITSATSPKSYAKPEQGARDPIKVNTNMTTPSSDRNPSGVWKSQDERPLPPPPFLRQIFTDMWEGMFALLIWTLALWVMTMPVILAGTLSVPLGIIVAAFTTAPGFASLLVPAANAARGGFARLADAPRGLIRLYGRSVALALPLVILAALSWTTGDIVKAFPGRAELSLIWALQIGFMVAMVILHVYLYPIQALYNIPLKQTVALAGVLTGKCLWQTLVLLALGVALLAATMIHPLVWLFVPGIWCVVVTNATFRMVRRVVPSLTGIDK